MVPHVLRWGIVSEHDLFYTLLQEVADMRRLAEEAVRCNDEISGSVASYMNVTNAIQKLPPVSGWVGGTVPIYCVHSLESVQ